MKFTDLPFHIRAECLAYVPRHRVSSSDLLNQKGLLRVTKFFIYEKLNVFAELKVEVEGISFKIYNSKSLHFEITWMHPKYCGFTCIADMYHGCGYHTCLYVQNEVSNLQELRLKENHIICHYG